MADDRQAVATTLRRSIRDGLARAADPDAAGGMQAYMKSEMPFWGVKAPERRRIGAEVFAEHGDVTRDAWLASAAALWRSAERREERYVAIDLLQHRRFRTLLDATALPLVEEIIRTGSWWDFVDPLASHSVGGLLRMDPERMRPVLDAWSRDDDIWIRRTAILAQLRFGRDTDAQRLARWIEPSLERREFFLAKAIGWALREYAKHDRDWVASYVESHAERLAPLSKREATKHMGADSS